MEQPKRPSLRAALAFGKLWKTTEELQTETGLSYSEVTAGIHALIRSGCKIAETYQDGSYMFCMAERIKQ